MILLDGQLSDSCMLSDRGLAYGDGLFETIAVRDGRLLAWSAHMARLARGCAVLGLPTVDSALLFYEARQVIAGQSSAVVKIMLTRGSGGRGYRPPATCEPRRIVSDYPWPANTDATGGNGVTTWVCHQRLAHNPQLAGIKHLNRLEQVLASAEWPAPHYFEGLMLDFDGQLIEGIRSNVFVVRGNMLLTPDLTHAGIAGVVREALLDKAASLGLEARIAPLRISELADADEVFLCNSVIGLRVVERIDDGDSSLNLPCQGVAHALADSLRAAHVIP